MAQNIILKRSSLPGKVPTTSSLNIGEVAVNTYDGKLFIKRSGSIESIEEVITTNTTNTGSITLTQTGSFGEIIVSNDVNIQRDLYVTRDIVGNGSIDILGDITGSSALLSGSLIVSGATTITENLTVLGEVNARQFNISVISSSILFESGSSIFGNTSDDTHDFTGSVGITGSLYLNGVELGGSSNSGSFTGSFSGDGSGLRGVVSDDLPIDGWDYESNSSASISEFNNESRKYIIDFQWEEEVGTPIGFKTFISNVTGSSQIVPTETGIKFIVGNQQVALVGPNGIESVPPAGTVSGSSQLTSSYDARYVLSGSTIQTNWDNITSKPTGIVSGSEQVISILDSLNSFSASNENTSLNSYTASNDILNSLQTTRIDQLAELTASNITTNTTQNTRLTTLESVTGSYATTGSNTFIGTQTHSGSIIPAIDNTYDLGSPTYQWKDIYVSSGSLYIDGTKVLGSTGDELQITTDEGQSIKILEAGSDNIILQSADGDIQLKSSGGGNLLFDPTTGLIDVRGTLQIQDGNKITSSGGNTIEFGDNVGITGSITTTGNINGVNIASLQSTFNTYTGSSNTSLTDLNTYTASVKNAINVIGEGNSSVTTVYGNLVVEGTTLTVSASNLAVADNMIYLNDGNEITDPDLGIAGNYNDGTYRHAGIFSDASDSHTWKVYKGYQPEPSQSIDTAHGTFTLADFQAGTLKGAIAATNGVVSGSSQVIGILDSLNTYTGSNDTTNTTQNNRLTSIESVTGSYETKGRSIVSGSSQIDVMSTTNIARLATTGSNSFIGNQIITGSLTTTSNAIINGGGVSLTGTASDTIQNSGTPFIYLIGGGSSYTTIQQATDKMRWWQFDGSSWNKTWDINYNGNATLTGTFTENSSLRYKENIETVTNGLDKVLQMRGVTYDKKNTGVKELGVIAEEIYEVLPEVVLKNEEGEIDSVSYGRITAVLIEAIKDLKKEIEDLKANR